MTARFLSHRVDVPDGTVAIGEWDGGMMTSHSESNEFRPE